MAPGGVVRVEVADRGLGIPEADRPKVFEAFHPSANSGSYVGTGLGLAICRRIVERHGGRIGVEQRPGAVAGSGSRCRCSHADPQRKIFESDARPRHPSFSRLTAVS
ncbi:sensor histidine kinase [Actinoplanes philippinensis]|uniref:sensor histidine kinase n=1 Tax=Actinoplanes philippinensis TaxID=35752 RepID=UPI001EF1D854|nr:ATP-binding protein [Actinoplanes philippinensis]